MRFSPSALPFLLLTLSLAAHAQTDTSHSTFFPDRLAFPPLVANNEEARLGLQQELGSSRLKIGIGGSLDLVEFASGGDTIRWGADLCAYALSNTFRGVLFKIAAADGLFGMHLTFTNGTPWSFRFRAIHLSGHLVDGNYDTEGKSWYGGREPFNYTRNYGELVAAWSGAIGRTSLRAYAGFSYAVWVRPAAIRPFSTVHGIEIRFPGSPSLYCAYNLAMLGIPAYAGCNTLEAGVKLGTPGRRGVRLFLGYVAGLEPFGALYNERSSSLSAGFGFDIW
jgi:hypothetical protein